MTRDPGGPGEPDRPPTAHPLRPPPPAEEVDEEVEFHIRMRVRELRRKGMTEEEARAEAERRLGDVDRMKAECRSLAHGREARMRRRAWWEAVRQGLSFAVRGLRRSPGFAAAVILTLALGIGANAVMFGVVDRLLLSPPQHVVDADRVRHLFIRRLAFNGREFSGRSFTYPAYRDLERVDGFAATAAYTGAREMTLGSGPGAERIRAVLASASLFPLLGVEPALGRFYGPDEDAIGVPGTAVLAHEFWESRFGADPGVLGRTLEIGDGTFTVVGVAPPGFTGAELVPVDAWLPLEVAGSLRFDGWKDNRRWWWLSTVARLADGAGDEAAGAEATAVHRAAQADVRNYDAEAEVVPVPIVGGAEPGWSGRGEPGLSAVDEPPEAQEVSRWLAGVSLLVLLIACANVANLLLARAVRWRREMAVRVALGVSRGRLVGQLLTEALVLAALGAASALLLAHWGSALVHDVLLPGVAFTDTSLGGRLLVFTAAAALVTAVLAGLVPALEASRPDVTASLKSGGRGGSEGRSRLRTALLVAQGALSVVLLAGAGLFVKSLDEARHLDLGFDADRALLVELETPSGTPEEEQERLYRDARRRVSALPGIEHAGLARVTPFWGSYSVDLHVPGRDSVPTPPSGGPYVNVVSSGYLEAMGLAVVRGRGLEPADDDPSAPPVAVVDEAMAGALWPDGDPLGACLMVGSDEAPCTEVVGVVEDHRRQRIEEDTQFMYYVNGGVDELAGAPGVLVARTTGEADDRAADARGALGDLGGGVRYVRVRTLRELVDPQLRSWRLGAAMFTAFGVLALLVAAVGLYSVLSFDVARRHHELGVRAALGADVGRLVGMVLRRALGVVALGVVLGLGASALAGRFVEPLLFRVSPLDPVVFGTVAAALLAVAALAGLLPAWRATRVHPTVALKAD